MSIRFPSGDGGAAVRGRAVSPEAEHHALPKCRPNSRGRLPAACRESINRLARDRRSAHGAKEPARRLAVDPNGAPSLIDVQADVRHT